MHVSLISPRYGQGSCYGGIGHYAPARGPDGVTSRDFLEEWYLFTLLLIQARWSYPQILLILNPNPCEMLAVKLPSIAPLWYSPPNAKRAPGRFIKQQMESKEKDGYRRLPGTRMKRQHNAASTSAIHARHISARLLRSFLSLRSVRMPSRKDHFDHTSQRAP